MCAFHFKLHSAVCSDEVLDNSGTTLFILQVYTWREQTIVQSCCDNKVLCVECYFCSVAVPCTGTCRHTIKVQESQHSTKTQSNTVTYALCLSSCRSQFSILNFRWAHKNMNTLNTVRFIKLNMCSLPRSSSSSSPTPCESNKSSLPRSW